MSSIEYFLFLGCVRLVLSCKCFAICAYKIFSRLGYCFLWCRFALTHWWDWAICGMPKSWKTTIEQQSRNKAIWAGRNGDNYYKPLLEISASIWSVSSFMKLLYTHPQSLRYLFTKVIKFGRFEGTVFSQCEVALRWIGTAVLRIVFLRLACQQLADLNELLSGKSGGHSILCCL